MLPGTQASVYSSLVVQVRKSGCAPRNLGRSGVRADGSLIGRCPRPGSGAVCPRPVDDAIETRSPGHRYLPGGAADFRMTTVVTFVNCLSGSTRQLTVLDNLPCHAIVTCRLG